MLEKKGDIKLLSTAACPFLGVKDCLTSNNEKIKKYLDRAYQKEDLASKNKHTHQLFLPEKTTNPHPRFLGLARSINERREKKVEIKVPLFQDENTTSDEAT